MRLDELFDSGSSVNDRLRQAAIDILVTFAARNTPWVTIQQVVDQLRSINSGMTVDNGLVMRLLDPTTTKVVSKIEGDRIYLATPEGESDENSEQDEAEQARTQDQIHKTAVAQAQKSVADQGAPPAKGATMGAAKGLSAPA